MKLRAPTFGACMLTIVIFLEVIVFVSFNIDLKPALLAINIATPASFLAPFAWKIFFNLSLQTHACFCHSGAFLIGNN
jgi:hypothetical protein